MRSTSIAAGLAMVTVAFVAAVGGEPMWGGTGVGENCRPTPRMSLAESSAIKREMLQEAQSCAVSGGWQMFCKRQDGTPCTVVDFELDHIIPLCLGGNNTRANLQLQSWPEARMKDIDEARVCRLVHAGEMSCMEGRELMRTWGRR